MPSYCLLVASVLLIISKLSLFLLFFNFAESSYLPINLPKRLHNTVIFLEGNLESYNLRGFLLSLLSLGTIDKITPE